MARNHPDRVRHAVLVGSVGPGCVTPIDRVLAAPLAGAIVARAALPAYHRLATRWSARVLGQALGGDIGDAVRREGRHHGRRVWRSFLVEQRALVRETPSLFSDLDSVTVPITVVTGGVDRVVPPGSARRLAEALPQARLHVLPGVGHHVPYAAPQRLVNLVLDAVNPPADTDATDTDATEMVSN
jgi:pimeloyl-ACP methyl ester carboxylesterase